MVICFAGEFTLYYLVDFNQFSSTIFVSILHMFCSWILSSRWP